MLDQPDAWGPPPDLFQPLSAPGIQVQAIRVRAWRVTGQAVAFTDGLGLPLPPQADPAAPYAVSLGPDRRLVVAPHDAAPAMAEPLSEGWHAAGGVAISDTSDGGIVFEVTGDRALTFLADATVADPALQGTRPQASAVTQVVGLSAIVYRVGQTGPIRLHVEAPLAAHFWLWAEKALPAVAMIPGGA